MPAAQGSDERPLRILHVIGAFAAGGAERMAVDLSLGLSRLNVDVALFALSGHCDQAGIAFQAELDGAGIARATGPTGRVRLRALRDYRAFLGVTDPHVIHLHTPNTELAHALAGSRAGRARVIRTIHSVSVARSLPYAWAYRRNEALSIACSDAVAMANADWAAPVQVIPNGVRFDWSIQSPSVRQEARERLGLRQDVRHYIMIGGMRGADPVRAPKAHDVLLRAWEQAGAGRMGAELHLIGDGNLRPLLEDLAGGDRSIRFHGVSALVSDWLLAADVFVMPSRYEGMPIAAIEALGTGLPCILSDIPSLRELAPEAAQWVHPGDSEALARALNPRAIPGPAVEDVAAFRRKFGMEQVVQSYLDRYRALAHPAG